MMFTGGRSATIETQEVDVEATIADASPRLLYPGSRSRWLPTEIRVRWTRDRKDGGAWSPWSPRTVVEGPRLRKSGERSETMTYSERFVYPDDPEFGAFIVSTKPIDESGDAV
jgi:hypothetical protein